MENSENMDKTRKNVISIIAAIGTNRELGKDNGLLWRIPEDLKRFKRLTDGHPVVMGRKTWESLPEKFRPLPNRTNVVVSRDSGYQAEGAQVATSFEDALALADSAPGAEEVFVIGGAQLYETALPHADRLHLTRIDATSDADVYFPPFKGLFTASETGEPQDADGLSYRWVDYSRAA